MGRPTTAKPVPIELGNGKEGRALLFTGPAIVKIEEACGNRSIFRLIFEEQGIGYLSRMVWGGLLWNEPDLKLDEIQQLVFDQANEIGIRAMQESIYNAMMEAGILKRRKPEEIPPAPEEKEPDPTKPA